MTQSVELSNWTPTAERAVLGGLILEGDKPETALAVLDVENGYFEVPRHRIIFNAIKELARTGKPFDSVSVISYLEQNGSLERAGGYTYIPDLLDSVVTTASLDYYIEILRNRAVFRGLADAATEIMDVSHKTDMKPEKAVALATRALEKATISVSKGKAITVGEGIESYMKRLSQYREGEILSSGYPSLDKVLIDLTGQCVIVAGLPSMGKTAMMLNMALRQAQHGIRVGIISLEMPTDAIIERLLQASAHQTRTGLSYLSDGQFREAAKKIAILPIWIDDGMSASISSIIQRMRLMRLQNRVDVIYIDYLQLITAGRLENRNTELGAIVRMLLTFAKDEKVAVVTGSQFNRQAAGKDTRPKLHQLRDSGEIEAHADIVLGLWRPSYAKDDDSTEFIVYILKNRAGIAGRHTNMLFFRDEQRIEEATNE